MGGDEGFIAGSSGGESGASKGTSSTVGVNTLVSVTPSVDESAATGVWRMSVAPLAADAALGVIVEATTLMLAAWMLRVMSSGPTPPKRRARRVLNSTWAVESNDSSVESSMNSHVTTTL